MIDDVSDISAYYDRSIEGEHERLERHQLEYDLTWRYLKRYLPARGNILEVGAATGRYTLELARKGYQVTAVDLSSKALEFNRQSVAAAKLTKKVRFVLADARQLPDEVGEDFHAALLMGPLYHLVHESDRILALQQVHARLRPGGIIVSTFISRFGLFSDLLRNDPEWIEDRKDVQSVLAIGSDPEGTSQRRFPRLLRHSPPNWRPCTNPSVSRPWSWQPPSRSSALTTTPTTASPAGSASYGWTQIYRNEHRTLHYRCLAPPALHRQEGLTTHATPANNPGFQLQSPGLILDPVNSFC